MTPTILTCRKKYRKEVLFFAAINIVPAIFLVAVEREKFSVPLQTWDFAVLND